MISFSAPPNLAGVNLAALATSFSAFNMDMANHFHARQLEYFNMVRDAQQQALQQQHERENRQLSLEEAQLALEEQRFRQNNEG